MTETEFALMQVAASQRSLSMMKVIDQTNNARVELLALAMVLVCATTTVDRDADHIPNLSEMVLSIANETMCFIVDRLHDEAQKIARQN